MNRLRPFATLLTVIAMMIQPSGCTVTETGNPEDVTIDTKSIYIQKADTGIRMVGEEGAVTPGESELRIIDLDTVSEPVDLTVNKNGSFSVDLEGAYDHVYRLRAIHGSNRSDPVNVSGVAIEEVACIRAEPSLVLQFPDTAVGKSVKSDVAFTNTCEKSVTLVEQGFRLRVGAIAMDESIHNREIKPGETFRVDVTFSPEVSGTYEAIAVFTFASSGRIVIDVVGKTPGSKGSSGAGSSMALLEAKAGVCYGEKTNCDANVEPLVSGYPFSQPITDNAVGNIEIDWIDFIEEVECPLPPCYLKDPVVAVAKDGSISVVATVYLGGVGADENKQSADPVPSAGVWFARYSAEGERFYSALVDFQAPPQIGALDHTFSMAIDSQSNTYVALLPQYWPGPYYEPGYTIGDEGMLSVYRYDPEGRLVDIPITRYGIQKAALFVDPQDNIVLVTHYRNPDEPVTNVDDPLSILIIEQSVNTRADISKYDRSGKLLWNQTGLNGDARSTEISEVGFDAQGNIISAIKHSASPDDWSWSIARLDVDGNVEMIRLLQDTDLGRVENLKMAGSPDGSWTILNNISSGEDIKGSFIDRYNADGAALSSWASTVTFPIMGNPENGTYHIIVSDAEGNTNLLVNPDGESPHLHSLAADGENYTVSAIEKTDCMMAEAEYQTPFPPLPDARIAAICGMMSIYKSPANALYFSSSYGKGFLLDDTVSDKLFMFRWSDASLYIDISGTVAIGRFRQPSES
jgi:hypothetical protein